MISVVSYTTVGTSEIKNKIQVPKKKENREIPGR
jgi:hypothetical protein